jgi:predicted dehydrogenase
MSRSNRKAIRVGIVGTGFAARFHRNALMRVHGHNIEIVGVYSRSVESRKTFATETGIEDVANLEDLIRKCDVLHICTPPSSHEHIAILALEQSKSVIIEKPFTGYFGETHETFDGDTFDREIGLEQAMQSVRRLLSAEAGGGGRIYYAENWVYAPAVQKEREIMEKTDAQILRLHGEESHSGSHAPSYGIWSESGGGSLMGKGVHPLTTALYLKCIEGSSRNGKPIRPVSVSSQVHAMTRSPSYRDKGYLRTGYQDIEDYGHMHVVFEDSTFADIVASELVMGGVSNRMEVVANNHRTVMNINPNDTLRTFNPEGVQFGNIYVVEKIETKEGWANTSPDENWFHGYQQEIQAFYENIADGTEPESGSALAADTVAVVYSAYLSASRNGQLVDIQLA